MRILFALLLVLLVPFTAFAHPGHVGPSTIAPSFNPETAVSAMPTVLLIAVSLGVVAWLCMLATLVYLRFQKKRATDRLMRARLYLGRAIEERNFWLARRDYWRAVLEQYRPRR